MKNLIYLSILILSIGFFLPSCKTHVAYNGLRPADINMPAGISNMVIINRYPPSRQNQWMNVLEGIFSGEMLFADRKGVDQAIAGLRERLQDGPKYKVSIANEQLTGTGLGMFPPPIAQSEVMRICQQYGGDALIAIEAFDSDIAISVQPRERKRTQNGVQVIEKFFEATELVTITIGWRTYDARTGAVIDQQQLNNTKMFRSRGDSEDLARRSLLFPINAIMQTAIEGGHLYALRIAPSWVNINRVIFTRAGRSAGMRSASKMARRGDWQAAAERWERLGNSPNVKLAKRALYNRAVAAEFLGNNEDALKYARIAADRYNLRIADQYIQTIHFRNAELNRLDQQLNN